jgi:hypothetical protein
MINVNLNGNKKRLSAKGIFLARMAAHEGCESTSIVTRQSKRAALRQGIVLETVHPKNRLKGPRAGRAAKQLAVRRANARFD